MTFVKAIVELVLWFSSFGCAYKNGPGDVTPRPTAAANGPVSAIAGDAAANVAAQLNGWNPRRGSQMDSELVRRALYNTVAQRTANMVHLKTLSELLTHACARSERCRRGFLAIVDHPKGEAMTLFAPSDRAFSALRNLPGGDLIEGVLYDEHLADILVRRTPARSWKPCNIHRLLLVQTSVLQYHLIPRGVNLTELPPQRTHFQTLYPFNKLEMYKPENQTMRITNGQGETNIVMANINGPKRLIIHVVKRTIVSCFAALSNCIEPTAPRTHSCSDMHQCALIAYLAVQINEVLIPEEGAFPRRSFRWLN
jgi:hypothetical protein